MNTEKAIKWLNNFKVCLDNEVYCDDDKKLTLKELREVIGLLERGEKFEKMWNDVSKKFAHVTNEQGQNIKGIFEVYEKGQING